MNVMRRRQRRSSEAVRLSKRKQRHAYELWQANQIKIWTGMNEQALIEENNLEPNVPKTDAVAEAVLLRRPEALGCRVLIPREGPGVYIYIYIYIHIHINIYIDMCIYI